MVVVGIVLLENIHGPGDLVDYVFMGKITIATCTWLENDTGILGPIRRLKPTIVGGDKVGNHEGVTLAFWSGYRFLVVRDPALISAIMCGGYTFIMIPTNTVSIRRATLYSIRNVFFCPLAEVGLLGKLGWEEDLLSVVNNVTTLMAIQVAASWGVGPCETKGVHPTLGCLQ